MRPDIGLGRLSLHIAGPDNLDRATRPPLLGTAAIGSVSGRHRRSGAGQSEMEWVDSEGGDSRDQEVALWESTVIHGHAL